MSETIGGSLQGDLTRLSGGKGQEDQEKKRKEDGTPLVDNGHDGSKRLTENDLGLHR